LKSPNLEVQTLPGDEKFYGAVEESVDTATGSSKNAQTPAALTTAVQEKHALDISSEGRGAVRKKRGIHQ
jgi:hypothetical protein